MRFFWLLVAGSFVGVLLTSTPAAALPISYTDFSGSVRIDLNGPDLETVFDSGQVTAIPFDYPREQITDGSGTAWADASLGTDASGKPLLGLELFAQQTTVDSTHLNQVSQASLLLRDTLTVTSTSLNVGDPVTLQFVLGLNAMVAGSSCADAASFGVASISSMMVVGSTSSDRLTINQDPRTSCDASDPLQTTFMYLTSVGAEIPVVVRLDGNTQAGINPFRGGPAGTGSVDASHTATLGIQSLTPGAEFNTASHLTYDGTAPSAPVPEPASIVLLGLGLGVMAARSKRGGTRRTITGSKEGQER